MPLRFYLIEDDVVTCRMLERIISDSGLGNVMGQAHDGLQVKAEDLRNVDVVLIDLLLPGRDGIETIKALREDGFIGRFIMISQVENKEMIGEAYLQGVDTFIQKPVNRLEIVSVLKRVADHIALAASLNSIRKSLRILEEAEPISYRQKTDDGLGKKIHNLLLELGIIGEAGAPDILLIMKWLIREEEAGSTFRELPPLKELYAHVVSHSQQTQSDVVLQREIRAMEQRIRRTVLQALSNLASLGVTDYINPTFEYYAPRLFDFQEVRIRMHEIEEGEKNTKCRIAVRKFLSAFYIEVRK